MIYATPFAGPLKEPTGPSQPAGFPDLPAVVAAMGPPVSQSARIVVYAGVAFSDFVIRSPADGSDT